MVMFTIGCPISKKKKPFYSNISQMPTLKMFPL